jgi:glycosidase
MLRWLLPLLLAALPACDTVCVGPGCPDAPPDEPWTPGVDDDDAADDDDATPPDEPEPEIVAIRSCDATLRYRPPFPASTVEVAGEFSGWSPRAMEGPDADGVFTASLPALPPGNHAYKYLHDGTWEGDPPASAWAKWLDGTENRKLPWGDCTLPLLQTASASGGPDGVRAEVQFARGVGGDALDPTTVVVTLGDAPVAASVDAAAGTISVDVDGLPPGKHSLRVTAADSAGRRAENEPLFVPLWVEPEPFSWEDGLIYFVFTDRFRDGDGRNDQEGPIGGVEDRANFQGGDLLGVLHALEEGYFERLGANILWLTPVYENPNSPWLAADGVHEFSGFHGYWPVDPLAIETRLGDDGAPADDRLRQVIDAAHARGIRVMFDLVLNHVHQDHTWVQQHPDWFGSGCVCGSEGCGWEEHARDCWFTSYLPDLDYRNHAIVEEQLEATLRLVETYDVDAVRVDAAKHMDHVIMRGLKKGLRTRFERNGGAPFYVVGETFTGGEGHGDILAYVGPDELDGQFDFPLFWSIREAFAHGGSFQALEAKVAQGQAAYGSAPMSPFLGNHDVPRFATEAAGNDDGPWGWTEDRMAGGGDSVTQWDLINRTSLGLLFTLTQPGVPLLYYGDEIGLGGAGDPDNRRRMTFSPYLSANQRELLGRIEAIGGARRELPALRRGERRQLWVDDDLLVYARVLGDDVAIVAMNKGGGERSAAVAVGDQVPDGVVFRDRLHPERSATVEGGTLLVTLGSWEGAVLAP